MKQLVVAIGLLVAVFASSSRAQDAASVEQIHKDLRALKDRAVEAVNKKDEAALLKELAPDIWFTAMNNETFHGLDQGKAYYEKMLSGASRIVDDMSLTSTPDDLAILYADNKIAVSTGVSNTHFKLMGGTEFDVPLRWTATLANDGSKWSIASIHFSANMFDNPILATLKTFSYWLAGGLAALGLVVGYVFGRKGRKQA
jgi:ketosteroid isomerase-like protein